MKRRALLILIVMMMVLVVACFWGCANIDISINNNPSVSDKSKDDRKEDEPKQEDPKEDEPVEDEPKQEDPKEEDPEEEVPKQEDSKEDEPVEDEPKQEDPKEDDPKQDEKPDPHKSTKTMVYYTDSNGWGNVYAYVWNFATGNNKMTWPGERLTFFGTSGFGEKQYRIEIDRAVYDRVIFNNGGDKKTKDLVVSAATSGYYGEDGIFTMSTENYGRVEFKTLTDTKNLSYIAGGKKKISVYTPPNYTTEKKYGVLYMFDGQNLFDSASGAQKPSYGCWDADVAVTNLVKNGGDGVIVVGIDNGSGGSDLRDQELTMSLNFGTLTSLGDPKYGSFRNGKLDELGNFIKQTLMPWVKSNYSVDTSREKTGIAGSSSGGLAAYYLGLRDNDLYGYIGAFSPAVGLFKASDWTKFYGNKDFGKGKPKVYVYCGKNDRDLEDMLLPETKRIKAGLKSVGFNAADITENYVDGGTHSEGYWRIAFTEFLGKMFG